jgi:hypothetical protein
MACTECGANKGHLMGCSQASIQIRATAPLLTEPQTSPTTTSAFEKYRLFVFPAFYLAMWVLSDTGFGRFVLRTFFGMWLHEFGHAIAAWLTGRWALPMPWLTFSFDRNIVVSILMFGGAAALIRFGRQHASMTTMALGGVVLLATLLGHVVPSSFQEPFVTFGGSAGAMVLGALVSCGFLVRSQLRLFQGGLRWGWLMIGSASWVDATREWWECKTDFALIPFGTLDGRPTDASRLVDEFGWGAGAMVNRFLLVAVISFMLAMSAFAAASLRERLTPPRSASRPAS